MKWTTMELIKLNYLDYKINETVDYKKKIIDDSDIYDVSDVLVTGSFNVYQDEEFIFDLNIKGTLILACAITLKEVHFPFDIDTTEVFSYNDNEESHFIDGITIDLYDIVWSNILVEKPMRILSKNAYDNFEIKNYEEKDKLVNKAFEKLKDFNK